jgi:formylglycine-generating enzyme required for sulfatase activity
MKPIKYHNLILFSIMLVLCAGCQQGLGDSAPTTATVELTPVPTATETIIPTPTERFIQTEVTTDSHGVLMVLIPAGEFLMGSERSNRDSPTHTVYLDTYLIDQFEVTNNQLAIFLNEFGNQEEGGVNWYKEEDPAVHIHLNGDLWEVDPGYDEYPVVAISRYGATAFCNWRGGRLPTEAEWEKAARGPDGLSPFPWGTGISCNLTNYNACRLGEPLPVGSFPEAVSPYGVHDMAGNVAEFTADWYSDDYYLTSPYENPTGPEGDANSHIVSRGGSWFSSSSFLKVYLRNGEFTATSRFSNVGFRCAANP